MTELGHLHPITKFLNSALDFWQKKGFEIFEGPEIETEYFNFDFLRMPRNHPARDVQDTFHLKDGRVLRTHTTSVQGRLMQKVAPPVRIVSAGKVFRNEATDATHEASLFQMDCFAIDKDITMAKLMGSLEEFLKALVGKDLKIKFYPHHYPFVEPGMDVVIFWKNKWLEVLGSGMIHPKVLENMGVDPNIWRGFAFGLGIDRLVMLLLGIDDIRWFNKGDLRFLKQF